MEKAWASIRRAVNIGDPEPYDRYFGCQHVEFNNVTLPRKAHPFAHVFESQPAAAAQSQHSTNDSWQHDPHNHIWTRYHLQPRKKLFELGDEGGEFAKSLNCERVTMMDKNVEFKGLPILNMHFSDESSTIMEDDMTVDQKVQTTDFWTSGQVERSFNMERVPAIPTDSPLQTRKDLAPIERYDMSSFLDSCVDAYCQLAKVEKSSLPRVRTPFTEAGIARPTLDEKETPGRLQPIASKVLMKILFAAKMARPDLLRATQSLASRVTKWSAECDIALHRLVSSVYSSTGLFLEGFVGDSFDDCQLWLFADADHAGEFDSKSTSGCAMFLVGPNTYFPLNAFSKKQTVVAHSSTEAEVVSANHAFRAEGIPMLALFEQLCIFKKLSQKAGVKSKPSTPEPEGPVFTRMDKEIDEIRYGNVDGGLSATKRLALPAMQRPSQKATIEERALAAAGLTSVPQTSDFAEWMKFRRFLDKEEDGITGWDDIFRAVLSSATVNTMGSDVQALELASGLMQCMTAHSVACDTLKGCPYTPELLRLARLEQTDLWDLPLPNEYVPGTVRPTVNAVPTLYVFTTNSALALITGKGRTLKKYNFERDFEAKKPSVVLEFAHEMMWGKDLRRLVRRNVDTITELMAKYGPQSGSHLRVISVVVWSGNELCGAQGIEPLPIWGQDSPQGDYMEFMADCKRHMSWWNDQLMEIGMDQAAIVGEPDELVYGLYIGMTFTHWMNKHCVAAQLGVEGHVSRDGKRVNRRQMLEYYNSMFHLLHVTDILKPQIEMARLKPVRPAEECIFRDAIPRKDEMPDTIQNMVRDAYTKVSKPTGYMVEAQEFTAEEIKERPPDFTCQDDDDDNRWNDVDPNEYEGPSVGKAKASHAAPESKAAIVGEPSIKAAAESSSSSSAPPKAAVAGAPAPENVIEGTVTPKFTIGQVPSYRFTQEENVNGEVVEHVVVEQHPYEMVIRSCWEMSGAENLRFPARLDKGERSHERTAWPRCFKV
eukprot:s1446_g7.t1